MRKASRKKEALMLREEPVTLLIVAVFSTSLNTSD